MQTFSPTKMAQYLLQFKLPFAKFIVDATTGNGKDTLFLAKNSSHHAEILAVDIQMEAIYKAKALLGKEGCQEKVLFIHDDHSNIEKYISSSIDIAVFNLGYLPGGNHSVSTVEKSTMIALRCVVKHLSVGGLVTVIAYPGHAQGELECHTLRSYLTQLPSAVYNIGEWKLLNHSTKAPILYVIEKIRSELREGTSSR